MIYDRKFIWPKAFFKNGHLTESYFSEKWSFDRKFIWPKVHFNEYCFSKNGYLTEKVFDKVGHMYYSNGIWTVGQMTIFVRSNDLSIKRQFFEKSFRSNKLSVKWSFSEKAFGQMNFRSNDHLRSNDLVRNFFSVKWHFLSKIDSVKWPFPEEKKTVIWPFDKMNFRSNGVRLNGDSVEWTFGQIAFGQIVFGQMVFRSNGLSVKIFRSNDFSVKWSRTQITFKDRMKMISISLKLLKMENFRQFYI
jgi:hypothetical protein